jgi:hypothetical protein
MDQEGWKVLMITSPTQACGKTLTAINLALSMSKLPGRSVCLIDLDLRRPSISKHLGLELRHSLAEYASGEAGLEDIQLHVDIGGSQLTLICNDKPIRNPAEVIASQPIADLINTLRSRPDQPTIIVDLPPLLVSDDVITFLPMADCSVMTVVENVTTNKDIESSEELLASTNVLGCVLNKSSDSAGSYYY